MDTEWSCGKRAGQPRKTSVDAEVNPEKRTASPYHRPKARALDGSGSQEGLTMVQVRRALGA